MNSLQVAGFPFSYTDLTKAWANIGLPLYNIGKLFEAHRKNTAALTSANQVVFDGVTTFAQHQADFLKTTIDDHVLAGRPKEQGVINQADTARDVFLSSVGHVRELSDIAVKANVTALNILNARVAEAFGELTTAFAAPVALSDERSFVSDDDNGGHIAIGEQAAPVEEVKPQHAVKPRTRRKSAPTAKANRRRSSRK